jgi:hypothetical protein
MVRESGMNHTNLEAWLDMLQSKDGNNEEKRRMKGMATGSMQTPMTKTTTMARRTRRTTRSSRRTRMTIRKMAEVAKRERPKGPKDRQGRRKGRSWTLKEDRKLRGPKGS